MKRTCRTLAVLAFTALVSLTACSQGPGSNAAPESTTPVEVQHMQIQGTWWGKDGMQAVWHDQTVELDLVANGTTGYQWVLELSGDVIKIQKEDYVVNSDMAGAPGQKRFWLNGSAEGLTTVEAYYMRTWEPKAENSLIFKLTIQTDKQGKIIRVTQAPI